MKKKTIYTILAIIISLFTLSCEAKKVDEAKKPTEPTKPVINPDNPEAEKTLYEQAEALSAEGLAYYNLVNAITDIAEKIKTLDLSIVKYDEAIAKYDEAVNEDASNIKLYEGRIDAYNFIVLVVDRKKRMLVGEPRDINISFCEIQKRITSNEKIRENTEKIMELDAQVYALSFKKIEDDAKKNYDAGLIERTNVIDNNFKPKKIAPIICLPSAKRLYDMGVDHANNKRHEEAITALQEALIILPKNPRIMGQIGLVKFNQRKFREAITQFSNTLNVYPDYEMAEIYRANAYMFTNDYANARTGFDKVLDFSKGEGYEVTEQNKKYQAMAYVGIGNLIAVSSKTSERFENAVSKFDEAIKLDPKSARAYRGKGLVKAFVEKKYEEAILIYDKAIELDPSDAVLYYDRHIVYYNLKEYMKALPDFEMAIKLRPELEKKGLSGYNDQARLCGKNLKEQEKCRRRNLKPAKL